MLLSSIKSIWLYPMIVDFRKQLDGLVVLVIEALNNVVKIIQFSDRPYRIVLYC